MAEPVWCKGKSARHDRSLPGALTANGECKECAKAAKRRHNASPAGREAKRRHNASPAGREAQRRYMASRAGREAKRRANVSPAGRKAQHKYSDSPEGREARRRWAQSPAGITSALIRDIKYKANSRLAEHGINDPDAYLQSRLSKDPE